VLKANSFLRHLDPLAQEYVPGNLSFVNFNRPSGGSAVGAELYKNVGIRYKGSKGSLEFCFSNGTGNAGSSE